MKKLLALIVILGIGFLVYLALPSNSTDAPTQSDITDTLTTNINTEIESESAESVESQEQQEQIMKATFTTNKGTFELELFRFSTKNSRKLCNTGRIRFL